MEEETLFILNGKVMCQLIFDVVGTHPNDGPEDPEFVLITDKTFQEYGMTKVRYKCSRW